MTNDLRVLQESQDTSTAGTSNSASETNDSNTADIETELKIEETS